VNLWKAGFHSEEKELDMTLILRCDTLDSALLIANQIAEKRNLKLKFISQMWLDFRRNIKESKINAF